MTAPCLAMHARAGSTMRVLLTSPSLDERENVSGISTLVREIAGHGKSEFSHFRVGRKDHEGTDIGWVLKQLFLPFRFWRCLVREKPDIVHVHTAFVPLAIMRDAVLTFVARFAGAPVLLHPNGGRFLIEDFRSRFVEAITAAMLRTANKILVLSEYEKHNLTRRWKDLEIVILPNAISTEDVQSVERKNKVKTILFFGRLHESKGLHEIIEACGILKKEGLRFNFSCYGTGPLKEFFIEEMEKVLGDEFYYGGVVRGKEKWRVLAESDIFLLPSRYGEGLPLAMLEAMAASCVPVVADTASVRTVIEEGKNGFVVEPYNAAAIVRKLKFLHSGEVNWQSLRENAHRTIKERFSIEHYIEKLECLYKEVANLDKVS